MNFISFAWTTPAVRMLEKNCTRRDWKLIHAQNFHAGDIVGALDKQFQYGGVQFGIIKLLMDPYQENTRDIPDEDFKNEGFVYLSKINAKVDGLTPDQLWKAWHIYPRVLWVVRFEVIEIFKD